jgi:hypothetical protein
MPGIIEDLFDVSPSSGIPRQFDDGIQFTLDDHVDSSDEFHSFYSPFC